MLGCCVITNRRGSANFKEDVPIPEKYKIKNQDFDYEHLKKDIANIFNSFEICSKEFNSYREFIKSQKATFYLGVRDLCLRYA